jgi:hypothetical protein
MRLENLYLNFGTGSSEEQAKYISEYRLRRAQDLERVPTSKKKSVSTKSKLELTEEEKVIMKMLGLKQKDILALRSMTVEAEEETVEETGELFKDETFDEEEEE